MLKAGADVTRSMVGSRVELDLISRRGVVGSYMSGHSGVCVCVCVCVHVCV